MRRFLEALAETGVVHVPERADAAGWEQSPHEEFLRSADAAARLAAPGEPPALDLDAARWSARALFRACCCLADRTVNADDVARWLREAAPAGRGASVQWSVDLFLRHLPELRALAFGLSPADPLVREVERLGVDWPLSSVGMPLASGSVTPSRELLDDPCLIRLYVDRIVARGDTSRLTVTSVVERARAVLGGHPELARAVAASLGVAVDAAAAGRRS